MIKKLKPVNEACLFKEILYYHHDAKRWLKGILCGHDPNDGWGKYTVVYRDERDIRNDGSYGYRCPYQVDEVKRCPEITYGDEDD